MSDIMLNQWLYKEPKSIYQYVIGILEQRLGLARGLVVTITAKSLRLVMIQVAKFCLN